MGYVYSGSGLDELEKGETPQVGRGECVDLITHRQRNPDGSFPDASNNALAFRVIE